MTSAGELLGASGPFAEVIDNFLARPQQQALADAVEHALKGAKNLIGEAGTGVGKTYAYLVPALRLKRKVIISTGTRHLQDQLFHKDLPKVARTLQIQPKTALLKGRANYLCPDRLAQARHNPMLFQGGWQSQLRQIEKWAIKTRSGDISECTAVPEDAPIWAYCVSEENHCREHEGDALEKCFCTKARRRAQAADVIVVNHYLLCADMALKETGFAELLPQASALVIDEAHQLPDVVSQYFGQRLSSRELIELSRDIVGAQILEAPDLVELRGQADELDTEIKKFRLALGQDGRREAWQQVSDKAPLIEAFDALFSLINQLSEALELASVRGKALESCARRAERAQTLLQPFDPSTPRSTQDILWYETYKTGFALNLTPLDVAGPFQRAMSALDAAWVFVSATLAVNKEFGHFRAALGLAADSVTEIRLDSPFDYRTQALLFAPKALPTPADSAYLDAVIDTAIPCIDAARGRTFFLFTSHRALNYAADCLRERIDYPLFVQGQMGKHDLIEAFRQSGNGVLLGTSSFWEGVDVRGQALSCVIIDRLPFASPGDPVMEARISAIKSQGGNAFRDYQLPQAIVALKQGVGRLIRDYDDRGVLVLCDPRLTERHYGQLFINSLPRMLRTRDADVVKRFFQLHTNP